jgi:hypothetical protein
MFCVKESGTNLRVYGKRAADRFWKSPGKSGGATEESRFF